MVSITFHKKLKDNSIAFTMEQIDTLVCNMVIVLDPDENSLLLHKRKSK